MIWDNPTAMSFKEFFRRLTGLERHDWQSRLALDGICKDQLIRVPTGFGKTAGVAAAWLWNRVQKVDGQWPRRLILCMPMRTLVEQTERAVQEWLNRGGLIEQPRVHVLLGGLSPSDWHLEPEKNAILIGTQDMLLSRALNRGYGSGRARWPMEYGLLNVDCLWVMDEIQLMDVGLATSAQLQGFANTDQNSGRLPRARRTWWMSATLQRDWLHRASALSDVDQLPIVELGQAEKTGDLWTVEKVIRVEHVPAVDDPKAQRWAEIVAGTHKGGITLAVTNTVKSAVALHVALEKLKKAGHLSGSADLRLVHSRFRGAERRQWAKEFLDRKQCGSDKDRIIVATQVIEAGVDISADVLVTELAPWASLVQRWGRCARYGAQGQIVVVDRRHSDESTKKINAKDDTERTGKRRDADRGTARPYELGEIEAASEAIELLKGMAGPAALEVFEKGQGEPSLLLRLYPYRPLHVLTRRELLDLFDTGPDLTGADIDISRFIREGDERDVTIWWWPIPENQSPHRRLRPSHDALCRVPVGEARKWLFQRGEDRADEGQPEEERPAPKKARPRAWIWSYLDGDWEKFEERHLYPGQTVLIDASAGGYDARRGFTGKAEDTISVEAAQARGMDAAEAADEADEQEDLSTGLGDSSRQYKTIATHSAEAAVEGQKIVGAVGLTKTPIAKVVELAGLTHDIGKVHPAFVGAIRDRNGIPLESALAKAPKGRWQGIRHMYDHSQLGKRPGFRHELASALALIELVWRTHPSHPALQGGREALLNATVARDLPQEEEQVLQADGIPSEIAGLDETSLNLLLYLVMCHHGKVRATLPMGARDQENVGHDGSLPIRGVRDGDEIPELVLVNAARQEFQIPRIKLHLDLAKLGLSKRYGPSWVERVLSLREQYGSFQLAWLEALLRAADVRASRIAQPLDSRVPENRAVVQVAPTSQDRDADLRRWIQDTISSASPPKSEQAFRPQRVGKVAGAARTAAKRTRRGA